MAPTSVFAKQFAGRIRQVGQDGETSGSKLISHNAVSNISGHDGPAVVGYDGGQCMVGGVMTCANRSLLQQLLKSAGDEVSNDGSEDSNSIGLCGDDHVQMSSRLVTGTPKAGVKNVQIPTLSSPNCSSVPNLQSRYKLVVPKNTGVPEVASSLLTDSAHIATGAPHLASVTEAARPCSRGAPSPVVLVSPSQRSRAKHKVSGYAEMHAIQSKPPRRSTFGTVKPAARPRCAPPAFDMLRQLDNTKSQAVDTAGSEGFLVEDVLEISSNNDEKPASACLSADHGAPEQGGNGARESAAQYVERMKRNFNVDVGTSSKIGQAAAPPVRARSSDACLADCAPSMHACNRDPISVASRSRPAERQSNAARIGQNSNPTVGGAASTRIARSQQRRVEAAVAGSDDESNYGGCLKFPGKSDWPLKADVGPADKGVMSTPLSDSPHQQYQASDDGAREGKQLFFSRKPRDVEYTPGTVEEYKQKFCSKEYNQLGNLGPDLEDESLLLKRAVQEKVKQWSKELKRVNKQRCEIQNMREMKPEVKPELKMNPRAKALNFAKNIKRQRNEQRSAEKRIKEACSEPPACKVIQEVDEQVCWQIIRQREKQHFEDMACVQEIKKMVNQLVL